MAADKNLNWEMLGVFALGRESGSTHKKKKQRNVLKRVEINHVLKRKSYTQVALRWGKK